MTTRRRGPSLALSLVLAVGVLGAAVIARAGEDKVDPDRPDVSNSTRTVPRGTFQVESGFEHARERVGGKPVERRTTFQTDLRAGLTDRVEARIETEPVVHLRDDRDDTGFGDVRVAVKYRFRDFREGEWWPSLGVQPFAKLPVAESPLGSGRPDFGVRALASFELPASFGLDLNAGLVAAGQARPDGYLLQALASASLSREFTERFSGFVEVFFGSRPERDGRHTLGLDIGIIYLLSRRIALDGGVETSLSGQGPDIALRAGLTVRLGR